MTPGELPKGIRQRLVVAGMLTAGALILFAANKAAETTQRRGVLSVQQVNPVVREIDVLIDTLLARHHIEKAWVKTWRVQTPQRKVVRLERRVLVPRDFVSLSFNHELSQFVSQYGARAVASERNNESTVTMHIIKDGLIVESLTFVVERGLKPSE